MDDSHDELGEYDDDDHTAKFGVGKRKSTISTASASSNNTVSALDRVKSLAKRNQEVRSFSWIVGLLADVFLFPRHCRRSKNLAECD